ncbi:hypothetical protein R3P38DRAFT_2682424 [Favolaschia claudopus]|uniref:Uncharacterized protein n=1 Tax=Favolaschia claudopus TaxID=2862362 RepID=A0AAW0DW70_9AGAR
MLLLYVGTPQSQRLTSISLLHWIYPSSSRFYSAPNSRGTAAISGMFYVSTLNPAALVPQDRINLSDKQAFRVRFPHSIDRPSHSLVGRRYKQDRHLYYLRQTGGPHLSVFPPGSSGFSYFYRPRYSMPCEGGLRFRLAESPEDFESAQDLLSPNGLPWQISLPQISCREHYHLRDQLLLESLVSRYQISRCRHLFREVNQIFSHNLIFRLNQEFSVNFRALSLVVVGRDKIHRLVLPHLFDCQTDNVRWYPWAGSAIARFEKSTNPQHEGSRVVHLRIVRIIESVSPAYEDRTPKAVVKPEAGQLLCREHGGKIQPWVCDIDAKPDTSIAVGFQMLWDLDK